MALGSRHCRYNYGFDEPDSPQFMSFSLLLWVFRLSKVFCILQTFICIILQGTSLLLGYLSHQCEFFHPKLF